MINILSPIINSAKKTWKGEEKFWKVFWLWGFLLYFGGFVLFTFAAFPTTKFYEIIKATYIQPFVLIAIFFVLPIFITFAFKRNIKNVKIENKFLKFCALFFILTTPLALSAHIFCFASFLIWAPEKIFFIFSALIFISIAGLNYLFYKNLNHQLKLIKPCHSKQ